MKHLPNRTLLATVLLSLSLPVLSTAGPATVESRQAVIETTVADVLRKTSTGTQFLVPAGWSLRVDGPASFLSPPEGGAHIALVDVRGGDSDAAVQAAWRHLGLGNAWPLKLASDVPGRDGWERIRLYTYAPPTNEQLLVTARAYLRAGTWTVLVGEMPLALADKRRSELGTITDRILPNGEARESFVGRSAHRLTPERVAALRGFVQQAQDKLGIPGVAMGLVQDGRVVYAGGQGVRALGQPDQVDANTRFLVASNTKAMTTLLLARMVDQGKFNWDTSVTGLWPAFHLGNDETTDRVQVKHLVCACTGLPRQDYEWLMQFSELGAADVVSRLAEMKPTSEFGALYQYSNPLAAAGGYLAGHVMHPGVELGEAYDRAMQSQVFSPLGMASTTFDFSTALSGNHAKPHARNLEGELERVEMAINHSIVPVRPAGGAWSTVNDMLRFVQMELDRGLLPDGRRYVSESSLLARREPQVKLGADAGYGMGLVVEQRWGVTSVAHGGSMIGYQTGMLWLPDHDTGIVLLTNADSGGALMGLMQRYLLEVLFDGASLAMADLDAAAARQRASLDVERAQLQVPVAADVLAQLTESYHNDAIGSLIIRQESGTTIADFGEWQSEIASRKNDDGSISLVTVSPGTFGFELVIVNEGDSSRLVMHNNQHEYTFVADPSPAKRAKGESSKTRNPK